MPPGIICILLCHFSQCYDRVQNVSPKLLYFMCFWGLPKASCLSIELKKSTGQHDAVKKHSFITMLGPWRSAPPCCAQLNSFLMSLYILYIMLLCEFALQSCPLSTVHCLQPHLLLDEGCFCVVALSICTVHMCCLKGLLLLWGPGIVLEVGTVPSPS